MTVHMPSLLLLLCATLATAQCPDVHVFGARETTAQPGYGSAYSVIASITNAFNGSTAEAITYPAFGSQPQCGGISYVDSAFQGVSAVASQVNSFNLRCPNTTLLLVGYSQGAQIIDDAYCGGGDTFIGLENTTIPISTAAQVKIAAAILMGDPRHIGGLTYNAGTSQASGTQPRPVGFDCVYANNIESYCDAPDPYCSNGTDATAHDVYASKYGAVVLEFVQSRVEG